MAGLLIKELKIQTHFEREKGLKHELIRLRCLAEKRNKVWLCECKYTKAPMVLEQVKKLESAAQVLKQVHEEEGTEVPEIHMWLISAGGFAAKVLTYIEARTDIYARSSRSDS
jgi:hypothetical protein